MDKTYDFVWPHSSHACYYVRPSNRSRNSRPVRTTSRKFFLVVPCEPAAAAPGSVWSCISPLPHPRKQVPFSRVLLRSWAHLFILNKHSFGRHRDSSAAQR